MVDLELQEKVMKLHDEFHFNEYTDYKIKYINDILCDPNYNSYRFIERQRITIEEGLLDQIEDKIEIPETHVITDRRLFVDIPNDEWYVEIRIDNMFQLINKKDFIDKIHEYGLDIGTIVKLNNKLIFSLIHKK